jgi:hypothetical protein
MAAVRRVLPDGPAHRSAGPNSQQPVQALGYPNLAVGVVGIERVELLACARHDADLLAHPYIGVEPVLLAAARLGDGTPRTGLFFQRRPKDCLVAAGDLGVGDSGTPPGPTPSSPNSTTRSTARIRRKGVGTPRPEDDRGAPARSRPSRGATPDHSVLPRVDERRDKELRSCSYDGGGRVLPAGQDCRTLTDTSRAIRPQAGSVISGLAHTALGSAEVRATACRPSRKARWSASP